jgi:hypothetical protein
MSESVTDSPPLGRLGMAISEAAYLKMLWERNVCPYCLNVFASGERVGSGRKSDGGFCSLDCFSKYHALAFAEKARLLKRRIRTHNDS